MEIVLLFLSSPFALKIMLIFIYLFLRKNIYLIQVHLIVYRPMDVYNFLKIQQNFLAC